MNIISSSNIVWIVIFFLLNSLAKASTLNLVYSGNLDGELEPCGCTVEGDMGGLKRHATMIDMLRKKDSELVFVSTGGVLVSDTATDRIKSKYILSGMASLNYDAVGMQWKDFNFGESFLLSANLPFVLSNQNSQLPIKRIIKRQKINIAFYQWLEDQEHQMMHADDLLKTVFDLNRFEEELKTSKQAGNITIVSTTVRKKRLDEKLPLKYIDILLRPARSEQFSQPEKISGALILEAGVRGMRFGQLKVKLDNKNNVMNWQHEVIDLNSTINDSPKMDAWYKEYNAELEQDYKNRIEIRKSISEGASPYAGAESCKKCHDEEYQSWQKTNHAHAFKSLEKVNKIFDSNCVGCHSVGFEQQGGFFDASITAHLKNVQCESCHGAARQHVDSKGKTLTLNSQWSRADICQQCHNSKHSPVFDMGKYWPQVEH